MTRVACGSCGWWWYRRTAKPHWWSRKRYEYDGAHFKGDGRGNALRGRWYTAAEMAEYYADCYVRLYSVPGE